MYADAEEHRPGDEQQQKSDLHNDQSDRDDHDEQAGDESGEERPEGDRQAAVGLLALERRIHPGVVLLDVRGDFLVGLGLLVEIDLLPAIGLRQIDRL
jgi:hypothetical protein